MLKGRLLRVLDERLKWRRDAPAVCPISKRSTRLLTELSSAGNRRFLP